MKKILFSAYFITNLLYAQNSVTDIDGNSYDYITYGSQQWTVEDAKMETYLDGTPIPQVTDPTVWNNLTTGAWSYYDNDSSNVKLYNWYAVMGIHDNNENTPNKEFAPEGWHVPSDAEWTNLKDYLINNGFNYDGTTTENKIAKSMASNTGWSSSSNVGAPGNNPETNNSSEFNCFPHGSRTEMGSFGNNYGIGSHFWTSTGISETNSVYIRDVGNYGISLNRPGQSKGSGFSVRFVQDSDGCSEPAAPTGNEEQTFCEGSTVADLMATGTTIQWYDASTGGNLLDSATSLLDGQFMYSSQTVNGCESIDRLSVTISIQDITITASATEVCVGESVQITIDPCFSDFSNWATGEPNNLALGTEHFGLFLSTGRWNDGPDSYTAANCIVESETNLGIVNNFTFMGIFENHYYYLYNGSDGWNNCNNLAVSLGGYLAIINSQLETNFIVSNLPTFYDRGWIGMYQDTNHPDYSEPGGAWFWLDGTAVAMTSNPSTYTWSTGDMTENISVTPIETTEYWVDVTTNGIIFREYITINVNTPAAPIGAAEQTFCDSATVSDLAAGGENIQWYDMATDGSLLDATSALTNGQTVYASQSIDGCESTARLEVIVSVQDIIITASATEICIGESVDLTVISSLLGGSLACSSDNLPSNLQNGLVGYWPFCGNANDESGNGNNGNVNGATLTDDRFGIANNAYTFNLNTDRIIIPPSSNYSSNEISFSFWINPNQIQLGWSTIIKKGTYNDTSTEEAFIFDLKGTPNGFGQIETGYKNDGCTTSDIWTKHQFDSSYSLLNTWTNYVITINSNNIQFLYQNGVLISETFLYTDSSFCNGGELTIGSEWYGVNYDFFGAIDDIMIWDRFLTQEDVNYLTSPYLWSTGDITENITVTPTETTEYWVDVTTNGVTCRENITINVISVAAPTGDSVQSFCDVSTIADLAVTGDDIQWYDSATGGTLLDDTTVLIDGQLVYASQTLDSCESLDRLGVSVEIDIITDPILITTELNFCLAREATLADLEIDAQGFELEWYDSYTGGTLLGLDTILEDAIPYYATLYDVVSGCESLMRLEVIPAVIPCEVIIYNAISLNDNGLNDYMVIENAEYFPFNTLEIFNRDGYLVYNQRKYGVGDNLFRGMANVGGIYSQGSNLPTGSYLYVFTYYNPYEQQEFVKKGFLTINNN